ncbi:MAG: PDZ domain-containing protein [Verrucomicrobia bacterium]|nr:PDZ domain-containing protein [Verrucomicrobiota bacterium]
MKLLVLAFIASSVLAATVDDIQRAIGNLGHERFAEREAAQQRLLEMGDADHKALLAACVPVYRETKDPEVKMRLKDVMATVVDKHLFRAPRGYLGVRLNRVHVRGGGQFIAAGTVIPPGAVWVAQVLDDTGAQKAGLQANDCIIGLDGKPCEEGPDGFIEYVQAKRPGEKVSLSVLRGATTNAVSAVLGELPIAEAERIQTKERGDEFFQRWLGEKTEPQKP